MIADDLRRSAAHAFVDALQFDADGPITVDDDLAHHLGRVLRLRSDDSVTISDGAGRWRRTRFDGGRDGVVLHPAGPAVVEPDVVRPTIACAIPKGDRLDWMVQKATELGAGRLVLLHAERSVVRWASDRVERNLERLRRIADEAARQSRRVHRLEIDGPADALDVLPGAVAAEPGGRRLTAHDLVIAVGPEGGWTDNELARTADRVSLGPQVLRVETAVLAAITLSVAISS